MTTDVYLNPRIIQNTLKITDSHLNGHLVNFWRDRILDQKSGGFNNCFDSKGLQTEFSERKLFIQAQSIFSLCHIMRIAFPGAFPRYLIDQGINHTAQYFKDNEGGGYHHALDLNQKSVHQYKDLYSHSFLMQAFAEYALYYKLPIVGQLAKELFDLIHEKCLDPVNPGYLETFDQNFNSIPSDESGQVIKSLESHLQMMESLTTLYEYSKDPKHLDALNRIVDWIFNHMAGEKSGLIPSMFSAELSPIDMPKLNHPTSLAQVLLQKPSEKLIQYGLNLKFVWLLLHKAEVCNEDWQSSANKLVPILEYCHKEGVDWENGGLYTAGPLEGNATIRDKFYDLQAEALQGFLSMYQRDNDIRWWNAFENIHRFLFRHMVNKNVGEWYPHLNREGQPLADDMGNVNKGCYPTLRAMTQTSMLLNRLL